MPNGVKPSGFRLTSVFDSRREIFRESFEMEEFKPTAPEYSRLTEMMDVIKAERQESGLEPLFPKELMEAAKRELRERGNHQPAFEDF